MLAVHPRALLQAPDLDFDDTALCTTARRTPLPFRPGLYTLAATAPFLLLRPGFLRTKAQLRNARVCQRTSLAAPVWASSTIHEFTELAACDRRAEYRYVSRLSCHVLATIGH